MRWLVLVVVAGCYSPSPYNNCLVSCAANLDCPTGQACFAGRCSERAGQCSLDASIDALDPNGDIDDDGILNGEDKCPTVYSTNRDHDGDNTGDECDPCPHLKGPTADLDPDGDKVGTGCDRRPTMAGEKRLSFNGFYATDEIDSWMRQGDFVVDPLVGRLVVNNLSLNNGYIELPNSFPANLYLATNVQIHAVGGMVSDDHHVGISTHRTSGAYHACQLHQTNNLDKVRHVIFNASLSEAPTPYAGAFIGTHRLQMTQVDATTICDADGTQAQRGILRAGGGVGLDASLVRAEFDFLFVVELP